MNYLKAYNAKANALVIDEPATFIADALIEDLRESNGLAFCPPEQRLALILELCGNDNYCLEEEDNEATEAYALLAQIRALLPK